MVLGRLQARLHGGHAITPLAIEDRGEDKFAVLVYDNNFPNTIREVDIDTAANTWNYTASTNPSEEAALYEGDASTKTLEVEYARNGLTLSRVRSARPPRKPGRPPTRERPRR